jgi:hypothetical protein
VAIDDLQPLADFYFIFASERLYRTAMETSAIGMGR